MNVIALPPAMPIPTDVRQREALIRALGFEVDDPAITAIKLAQYVLVHNDGPERWRCQHCNVRHDFYTRQCIPLPWRGLEHALYGYWTNVGDINPADLTASQRIRLDKLMTIFGRGKRVEPLARLHPRMAHALGTRETDAVQGAEILGTLEPITVQKARFYASLIVARGDVCQL